MGAAIEEETARAQGVASERMTDRANTGHTGRMRLLLAACLGALALLSGCAETTSLVIAGDAAPAVDTPAVAPGDVPVAADGGVCPAPAPAPALPPTCAGLTELAVPANLVPGVVPEVTTYALASVAATADREHPTTCIADPWQDGSEAVVRFTAPTGGRWRLTARGLPLGVLRASRGCGATGVCAGFAAYHGPHVTAELSVDVQAQRGEGFSVLIDGCPAGQSCTYSLRAERVGPLACAFTLDDPSPCAAGQVCTINPCDPERFACAPATNDRLESARVLVDRSSGLGYIVGRLRPIPAGTLRSWAPLMMINWLRADGADAPRTDYATLQREGADFAEGPMRVPAEATRARLWLYEGSRPMEAQMADGIVVDLDPWSPRTTGQRCDDARLLERCAEGLRCTAGGCVRPPALEVTGLRAWRDPSGATLRLRIEGVSLGETVTQATVDLLDPSGATLATLPGRSVLTLQPWPSMVPFASVLSLAGAAELRALPRAARVRVRVIDTTSRTSAPFEAPLEATTVVGVGAPCVDVAVSCGAGLFCDTFTSDAHCEPVVETLACRLPRHAGVWAPPSSGTWTVEGIARGTGAITSCQASRVASHAAAEFVAPTAGRYVFEARGLWVMELRRACDAAEPVTTCAREPAGLRIEAELGAGERVALEVMAMTAGGPFAVTVRVP